jgi:sugar porter (SP) family MFS transporter
MHTALDPAASTAQAQLTPYVWLISVVAACGGLLFGYDWVVIGGAAKFYEAHFHLTDSWSIGWAQGCALLGCLVGALASGTLSDRYGRKPLLLLAAVVFVVSSIGIALVDSFTAFWLWRVFGGVGIGLASNISPLYIAEIAPARVRGMLVSLNQLTIVVGVFAAQIVNWRIAEIVPTGITTESLAETWNATTGWRWMFAACTVPSLVFLVGAMLVPESPRWLLGAGRDSEARAVLAKVGGSAYAEAALADIRASLGTQARGPSLAALLDRRLLGVLLLGCGLAAFQQWCGINVIFNYAGEIFAQAGYDLNDVMTNIVATGAVNLLFTFVAIATVDRLGRRKLLLIGAAALTVIYLALAGCYAAKAAGAAIPPIAFLLLVLAAIGAYAMSLAPVVWVVISEIFPTRVRGAAMSVAVSVLWIACFLLTVTFPALNERLGPSGTFATYAGICLVGLVLVALRLPETKGRSLEDIERELTGGAGR